MKVSTRTTALCGLISLSTLAMGCGTFAGHGATMRLTPKAATGAFAQRFEKSFAVERTSGETDVVLVGSGKADVDQVMHVRVLWKPMRGTKTDQPSTTNAVIDWYVFAPGPAGKADMLRYTGAGFVLADRSGKSVWVSVKSATLKLATRRGAMTDPIGPATLNGTFYAETNADKVEQALSEIKTDTRAASATFSPASR